ncbi:MAG: trypsin-like peptidase domain-containing protein [Oscillospiraceae bacterium]|nr:trypsin-like peptidase domain-containing protein [Oscillospiraceae bacterium]
MRVYKIKPVFVACALLACSLSFTNAEATVVTKTYRKFDYATNTPEDYTLSIDVASQSSPRIVLPPDDRVLCSRSEYDGIVGLSYGGAGFIVDDHVIATAAHCVGDGNGALHPMEPTLYGDDGYPTGETLTVLEVHIPMDYIVNKNESNDFALIYVEEDLSEHVHFSLSHAYTPTSSELSNVQVYTAGIPSEVGSVTDNDRIALSRGNLLSNQVNTIPNALYYSMDTSPGNSGGPVYVVEKFLLGTEWYVYYSAIGVHSRIHSSTANCGPQVNSEMMQFYLSNPNIGN